MSNDGDESRANRLRDRRRRSRSRTQQDAPAVSDADETDKTDEPSEPSKPSKQSETSKPEGSSGTSVKDEQVGTYMYLPESLAKELAYQFKLNGAEFEHELDAEFEKNRHWYPLVVSLGLEQIEEMDPEEMQAALASIQSAE